MAVDCDPLALAQNASCLQACVNAGMSDAIKIYLLATIAGVDPDPQALIAAASCLQCALPPGMAPAVQASLLCQIANAGGNGGECDIEALPDNQSFFGNMFFESPPNGLPGVTAVTVNATQSNSKYQFVGATDLTSLSFPNLTTYGDGVNECGILIDSCPAFLNFSAPNLVTALQNNPFGGPIAITVVPMVSFSLPELITHDGAFSVNVCSSLTTISLPKWIPSNGQNSFFSDNALLAASVNHILARHVASPTWGNAGEVLTLNGGTNAAPSGQGILDKATLIGRGAAVNTN